MGLLRRTAPATWASRKSPWGPLAETGGPPTPIAAVNGSQDLVGVESSRGLSTSGHNRTGESSPGPAPALGKGGAG